VSVLLFKKKCYQLFSWLVNKVPTSDNIYVFHSYPDFTDNPYGVYQELLKQKKSKLIWLISEKEKIRSIQCEVPQTVLVYHQKSLKGLWYFCRAGYLFVSHGIFESYNARSSSKKVINLWHGMPLKKIGFMDGHQWVSYSDALVATSDIFQKIMAESFGVPLERTFLVGQPRNDLLFEPTDFYKKNGIDRQSYRTVGIWLPTYRIPQDRDRVDGAFSEGKFLFFSMAQLQELDEFLFFIKGLLIVKLHPMDSLQSFDFPKFHNILIIKQHELDAQLYPLLGSSDYLLTDYSSVWVDYDVLDKPMAFVMDDFEEYKQKRGFTIPELSKILPGPIVDDLEKLKKFIADPQTYKIKTGSLFNLYKDNQASRRLLTVLDSFRKD